MAHSRSSLGLALAVVAVAALLIPGAWVASSPQGHPAQPSARSASAPVRSFPAAGPSRSGPATPAVSPATWSELGSASLFSEGAAAWDVADGYGVYYGGIPSPGTWEYVAGVWSNATGSVTGAPPALADPALAYDAADGYVLLFGGRDAGGYSNQTWNFSGDAWRNITASAGSPPPARGNATMTYDPADGYVVLFGGQGARGFLNDTWKFVGGKWSNLSARTLGAPSARVGPGVAYDPTAHALVLFGGISDGAPFGDTWEFQGGEWYNITSSFPLLPSPRDHMLLGYDPSSQTLVLFGGWSGASGAHGRIALGDTWLFVTSAWSNVTGQTGRTPTPRGGGIVLSDPVDDYLLLCGGTDPNGLVAFTDQWAFASGNWTQPGPPTDPAPGFGASLAYDGSDGYDLLVAGTSDEGSFSYRAGYWSSLAPALSPSPRYGAAMIYDPSSQSVLYFGGMTGPVPGASVAGDRFLADTWSFRGGLWSNLTGNLTLAPAPRAFAGIAYDPGTGAVLLFGGLGPTGALQDTWSFLDGSWRNVTGASPDAPAARFGAAMTYDPSTSRVLLFGGFPGSGEPTVALNDTWSYSDGRWTPLTVALAPSPRGWVSAAADSNAQDVVLVGGQRMLCAAAPDCPSPPLSDTWVFDNGTWTNLTSSLTHAPTGAVTPDLVYDAYLQAILFVGAPALGPTGWWVFHHSGGQALRCGAITASVDPATVGRSVELNATVTGGLPPYAFTWEDLPSNCSGVRPGAVWCDPIFPGNFTVLLRVVDFAGTSTQSPPLSLAVLRAPSDTVASVHITPATLVLAPGDSAELRATAENRSGATVPGRFNWSLAAGANATLSATSGADVILEAGASDGSSSVLVNGTGDGGGATAAASFTIQGTELAIVSFNATPLRVQVGVQTNLSVLARGGTAPYTLSYQGLPPGCATNDSPSVLCTPSKTGSYRVTVTLVDAWGLAREANLTLEVLAVVSSNGIPPALLVLSITFGAVAAVIGVGYLLGRREPPEGEPEEPAGPALGPGSESPALGAAPEPPALPPSTGPTPPPSLPPEGAP
jgi:hypothetical protein